MLGEKLEQGHLFILGQVTSTARESHITTEQNRPNFVEEWHNLKC